MTEKVYFEHEDVKVTANRFVTKGTTYPIHQITSVKMNTLKEPAEWNRTYGCLAGLTGFLGIGLILGTLTNAIGFTSGSGPLCPGILLFVLFAGALGNAMPKKGLYEVKMVLASTEVTAYSSDDEETVEQIIDAINHAIEGTPENTKPVSGPSAVGLSQAVQANPMDSSTFNLESELKKLAELKEAGLIDDEEYKELKRKLIDRT